MDNTKLHKVLFFLVLFSSVCLFSTITQAKKLVTKSSRQARDSHFNQDGFLKIDGTARLIIGLYELPKEEIKLREIAENGFNLVRVTPDIKTLDRLHKHKLYGWICIGSSVKLKEGDEKSEQKLAQIINDHKRHPALLVWELPDEVLWNIWWSRFHWVFSGQQLELRKHIEKAKSNTTDTNIDKWSSLLEKANDYNQRGLFKKAEEIYNDLWKELRVKNPHPDWKESNCPTEVDKLSTSIARGCKVIRQLDPSHIIWQNHAPRNSIKSLKEYNKAVDAAGCDIYPVPFNPSNGHSDLKDTNLSSVGELIQTGCVRPLPVNRFGWCSKDSVGGISRKKARKRKILLKADAPTSTRPVLWLMMLLCMEQTRYFTGAHIILRRTAHCGRI